MTGFCVVAVMLALPSGIILSVAMVVGVDEEAGSGVIVGLPSIDGAEVIVGVGVLDDSGAGVGVGVGVEVGEATPTMMLSVKELVYPVPDVAFIV